MRIYLMRLKNHLRDGGLVFWSLVFPLILGTFFYLGFGTLSIDNFLSTADIYIASDFQDEGLIQTMEVVEYKPGKKLFNLSVEYTKAELDQMLDDQAIGGYLFIEDEAITYVIQENGLTQTVVKSFLDEYIQKQAIINEIIQNNPEKLAEALPQLLQPVDYIETDASVNADANKMIIYFYALIAMACMFGTYWGMVVVNDIQPNLSTIAARVNVTPTHKLKLLVIYSLAGLTMQFTSNSLLLTYLKYVLKVDFSDQLGFILLTMLLGSLAGIGLGALLSSLFRGSLSVKEGLMTVISLFLSFLSGLMSVDIKYVVTKHAPFMGYINPANLIVEALYSLYYFDTLDRYLLSISLLGVLSIVFILFAYLAVRGKKYDSI